MKILRGMIVAWMVFWLGASGALAAVMPYCDHALRSGAAMDDMAMRMQDAHAPSHHGHGNAPVATADAGVLRIMVPVRKPDIPVSPATNAAPAT